MRARRRLLGTTRRRCRRLRCGPRCCHAQKPALAILGAGRRDVSTDADLPLPVAVRRDGHTRPVDDLRVTAVNDQHAMVAVSEDASLEVGDLVCLGVSHPCTTFDKWRLVPVVTDKYEVIDAVRTYF